MRRAAAVGTIASAALASCFFEPSRPGATTDGGTDGSIVGTCAGSVTWSAAHQLSELGNVGVRQFSPWLSKDKSELWFTAVTGSDELQLWHATWGGSAWSSPAQVFDFGSFNLDPHVVISDDGLDAWFAKMQSDSNIYTASRMARSDPFSLGGLASFSTDGSSVNEEDPAISGDGKTMVFSESHGGGGLASDLMITTRPSVMDDWTTPVALTQLNTSFDECCAALSEDGNTLLFTSNKTTDYTIFVATRANNQSPFGSATVLPHQITGNDNSDPVLSRDGLTLIFASDAGGGSDRLYQLDGTCNQ